MELKCALAGSEVMLFGTYRRPSEWLEALAIMLGSGNCDDNFLCMRGDGRMWCAGGLQKDAEIFGASCVDNYTFC